jgi:hypothetical protein
VEDGEGEIVLLQSGGRGLGFVNADAGLGVQDLPLQIGKIDDIVVNDRDITWCSRIR